MNLFTDVSSLIGYGAFWNGHWLQEEWSPANRHHSIQWKELYAILMAYKVGLNPLLVSEGSALPVVRPCPLW